MESQFGGDPVDVPRDLHRVDAVDQLEERESLAHLIRLQMPDEMPAQPTRQFRNLHERLLHAALPEEFLARLRNLADQSCGMGLGDRHKLHVGGITASPCGRRGDAGADDLEIFSRSRHGEGMMKEW